MSVIAIGSQKPMAASPIRYPTGHGAELNGVSRIFRIGHNSRCNRYAPDGYGK